MTLEEFQEDFENRRLQIHAHDVDEWDACLDILTDLGYKLNFDRVAWRNSACFYILNHGRKWDSLIGLNEEGKSYWGEVIEYEHFLRIVNGSRDDRPLIAASSAEIMTLLGM